MALHISCDNIISLNIYIGEFLFVISMTTKREKENPSVVRSQLLKEQAVKKIIDVYIPSSDTTFKKTYASFIRRMSRKGDVPAEWVEDMVRELIKRYWTNLKSEKEYSEEGGEFYGLKHSQILRKKISRTGFSDWSAKMIAYGLMDKVVVGKWFNSRRGIGDEFPVRYSLNFNMLLYTLIETRRCTIVGESQPLTLMIGLYTTDEMMLRMTPKELIDNFGYQGVRGMFTNKELEKLFSPEDVKAIRKGR